MKPDERTTVGMVEADPDYQLKAKQRRRVGAVDLDVIVYCHVPTQTFWARNVSTGDVSVEPRSARPRAEIGDWYRVERKARGAATTDGVDYVGVDPPGGGRVEVAPSTETAAPPREPARSSTPRAEPRQAFSPEGELSDEFVKWLAAGNEPSSGWFSYLRVLANEVLDRRGLTREKKGDRR